MVLMTTASFYTTTAYTPTSVKTVLKVSQGSALLVTLCLGLSKFFWQPVGRNRPAEHAHSGPFAGLQLGDDHGRVQRPPSSLI